MLCTQCTAFKNDIIKKKSVSFLLDTILFTTFTTNLTKLNLTKPSELMKTFPFYLVFIPKLNLINTN